MRRALLLLALGLPSAAHAEEPAAIELPRREWAVLHCGFARGVLYMSYTEAGRAHVVPAFPTEPVLKACARAGHPVAASVPVRTPLAIAPITIGPPTMPPSATGTAPRPAEPAITVQALGGSITVEARNDGRVPLHCQIGFSWLAEGQTTPQSTTTQAVLPPGQAHRVLSLPVPGGGAQLVGSPRWHCVAAN